MTRIADFVAGRSPAELYETYLSPGLFKPWAEQLIDAAPPTEGVRAILDLGCGTGVVSRALAARAPSASIVGVDVAPPMIDEARRRAATAGVGERIDFRTASADELPFSDGVFDGVYCQQALQFFPDKAAALREARRVLKGDRGRDGNGFFVAAVWTFARDGNPVFEAFEEVVGRRLGEDLLPFGPFSFGDPESLCGVCEAAGFKVRTLDRLELSCLLPDPETFTLFDVLFLGRPGPDGALQPVIAADDPAGDATIANIIGDLTEALSGYLDDSGRIVAPMTANLVVADA